MTVHPYLSLAPCLKVQERVAHLLQREVTTMIARFHQVGKLLGPFIALNKGCTGETALHFTCFYLALYALHHIKCFHGSLIIIGNGHIHPLFRRQHHFYIVSLCGQGDVADNTLEVLDSTAKVNTAHAFYDDNQFSTLLHGRQGERFFVLHAVNLTYIFLIDKYLSEVVELACEQAL